MKLAISALLALTVVLAACSSNNATGGVVKNTAATGAEKKVVMNTDEGKVEMTGSQGSGGWCDEGADWSWIASGQDQATAKWTVEGIQNGGKYDGLCHIHYEATSTEGDMVLDYYINEDQDSGFMEMTLPTGQKFSQEWSK